MGFTLSQATSILSQNFSSDVYIGLHVGENPPNDDGTGFVEPDSKATGYSRAMVGDLDKSIAGQIANKNTIFYDESINDGYGTVTHFGAFTGSTAGTGKPFFIGALTTPQTIGAGYIPIFRKHKFVIGLDKGALESYD